MVCWGIRPFARHTTVVDERLHGVHPLSRERAPRRVGRSAGPRIAGLAVANGDSPLTQSEVLQRLGLAGDEFAERIFARCGAQRRHLDLSDELLARSAQGRTERVEDELLRRSLQAVERLELDPGSIGTLLTSSLYSLGGPTLAHRLVERLRLDPATDKYHVTGVGCASAVPLMRLAAQALHGHPHKQVLIVAAESMSSLLTRAGDGDPRAKTVGASIFGDGCAAALLSAEPDDDGPLIRASQVHQIPDSLHAVSISASEHDAYLHLARELPEIAAAGLDDLLGAFLRARNVRREAIDHWIVHPGGRRVVEGVRDALALDDEDVALSWRTLAEHGNVGTPAIFYVLQSTIEQRRPGPGELGLVVTIGPGVTIGLMLLQW